MSRRVLSSANHWLAVDTLLRRWLAERRRLLSLYCSLSLAVKNPGAGVAPKLNRFCEILVDYVSAGHFEVYCELFAEGERSGASSHADVAELYRLIVSTTAVALDFNDQCMSAAPHEALSQNFSRLGQVLSSRFDWEDALIRHLHPLYRAVA